MSRPLSGSHWSLRAVKTERARLVLIAQLAERFIGSVFDGKTVLDGLRGLR